MSMEPDLTIHIPNTNNNEGNWSQTIKNLLEAYTLVGGADRELRENLRKLAINEISFQLQLQEDAINDYTKEKKQQKLKDNNIVSIKGE